MTPGLQNHEIDTPQSATEHRENKLDRSVVTSPSVGGNANEETPTNTHDLGGVTIEGRLPAGDSDTLELIKKALDVATRLEDLGAMKLALDELRAWRFAAAGNVVAIGQKRR